MKRNVYIILPLIALAFGGAFFLLPKSNCEDEPDPQIEKLLERVDKGELEAIAALYRLNKQKGITPLEEYWALKGALLGDSGFQKVYVTLFKSRMNPTEQQRVINSIDSGRESSGAACLLEMLRSSSSEGCNEETNQRKKSGVDLAR